MAIAKVIATLCAAFQAGAWQAAPGPNPKPHIVLILADDYGWANLGVHRRDADTPKQARLEVQTPNLDALIDDGLLLDRHYAYRICSPSRSSLQSGRLAVHVNTVNTGVTVVNVSDPVSGAAGIPRNMTGLAQKLRGAGYRTHMVGKWDAGMATPEHTPLGRGYDSWLGYFQHANDYWRKNVGVDSTGEIDKCLNSFVDLFAHNETYFGGVRDGVSMSPACANDPESHEGCYEESLFKERALSIVRNHDSSTPLFLFYSFHLLHTPLQVPRRYLTRIDELVAVGGGERIDSANRRLYAAMTLYMDEAVGDLVSTLRAKGMWDDTLVVFTSDNGGPVYIPGSANNHPLKGGKYSDWEGGVRVNAFLAGGFLPREKRGTRYSGVISVADWYGTLCELAGVDPTDGAAAEANVWLQQRGLPLLPPVDSVAQWGFILNGTNGRASLQLSEQALLRWPYKLVTGKQVYSGWQGQVFPNCTTIEASTRDQGPSFTDLKVFDHSVRLGGPPEVQQRTTWTEDCGAGCLFNVETDPTEHFDLAQDPTRAPILAKLTAELRKLNQGVFDPRRGAMTVRACLASVDNGGYYGPFMDADGVYTPLPPRTPGEYLKDAALKRLFTVLNRAILLDGSARVAETFAPVIRHPFLESLDTCLVPPARRG